MSEFTPSNLPQRPGFRSLGLDYQPPDLEEVQAMLPREEVIDFIGHGGMGTYYRARQPRLDRLAAIKVLLVDPHQDARLIEDFKREAEAMAALNHNNIIKIYDFGEVDSKLFMVMEHVPGQTLEYLLQTIGFEMPEIIYILTRVCDALEYAHEQGVIHRDLRLGNTMVDEEGRVKVGDFGLARLIGEELFRQNLIEENKAMGTMEYVAPEQHSKTATVDHRADIYSVGVMLFKMTTQNKSMEEFVRPSHLMPGLNPLVDEIVINCMQPKPEKRYQRIADLRTMISKLGIE